jgi:hypothetical protein
MMPVTNEISMAVGTTLNTNDVMRKLMPLRATTTKLEEFGDCPGWGVVTWSHGR